MTRLLRTDWALEFVDPRSADRAHAGLRLAALAVADNDYATAFAVLGQVAELDDPAGKARALFRLGQALVDLGRSDEAERVLNEAFAHSDPALTPDVHVNIAARWSSLGRTDDAVRAYEAVMKHTSPSDVDDYPRLAAFRLGHLLNAAGNSRDAAASFLWAAEADDPELSAHALAALVEVDRGRGLPLDRVEPTLRRLISLDHPDLAPQAALTLGNLWREAGDIEQARDLYDLVIESEHPVLASEAQLRLNELVAERLQSELARWTRDWQETWTGQTASARKAFAGGLGAGAALCHTKGISAAKAGPLAGQRAGAGLAAARLSMQPASMHRASALALAARQSASLSAYAIHRCRTPEFKRVMASYAGLATRIVRAWKHCQEIVSALTGGLTRWHAIFDGLSTAARRLDHSPWPHMSQTVYVSAPAAATSSDPDQYIESLRRIVGSTLGVGLLADKLDNERGFLIIHVSDALTDLHISCPDLRLSATPAVDGDYLFDDGLHTDDPGVEYWRGLQMDISTALWLPGGLPAARAGKGCLSFSCKEPTDTHLAADARPGFALAVQRPNESPVPGPNPAGMCCNPAES